MKTKGCTIIFHSHDLFGVGYRKMCRGKGHHLQNYPGKRRGKCYEHNYPRGVTYKKLQRIQFDMVFRHE